MAFTDRLRKRISSPVGFAGGTLEEQLLRAAQETGGTPQPEHGGFIRGPQPTMADQAIAHAAEPQPALAQPMARSRSFKDALSRPMPPTGSFEPPQPTQTTNLGQGSTFTEGGTDDVRARRTQPRDFIADDEAYLRDLRNKPRTWRDKLVDVTDALNVVAGGQKRILPTKRERAIGEVEDRIGQGLTIGKTRQAIEQGQMVPVQLESGETVMAPARTAGTLRGNQQNIKRQNDALTLRREGNKDRKNRWDAMDKRDRTRNIIALYNSGGLNDPELLEYAADQLALPAPLREKFVQGQIRGQIGEDGNLINVNMQTNTAAPVLDTSGKRQRTYAVTQEGGRNARAAAANASREKIATTPQRPPSPFAAPKKEAIPAAIKQDIAKGYSEYDDYHTRLTKVDDAITKANQLPDGWKGKDGDNKPITKNDLLTGLGNQRASIVTKAKQRMLQLNQLDPENEWGSGAGGYPYRKPKGNTAPSDLDRPIVGTPVQKSGRTIEGAIEAFKRNKKLNPSGRAPTTDEIARMKAALGQ